jgi:hypothetical protein
MKRGYAPTNEKGAVHRRGAYAVLLCIASGVETPFSPKEGAVMASFAKRIGILVVCLFWAYSLAYGTSPAPILPGDLVVLNILPPDNAWGGGLGKQFIRVNPVTGEQAVLSPVFGVGGTEGIAVAADGEIFFQGVSTTNPYLRPP